MDKPTDHESLMYLGYNLTCILKYSECINKLTSTVDSLND